MNEKLDGIDYTVIRWILDSALQDLKKETVEYKAKEQLIEQYTKTLEKVRRLERITP